MDGNGKTFRRPKKGLAMPEHAAQAPVKHVRSSCETDGHAVGS